MKKICFLVILVLSFVNILEASCTYTDKKELNSLSSYVEYDYSYSGDYKFNVNVNNLTADMSIEYDGVKYNAVNGTVNINGVLEGTSMKIKVVVNDSHICVGTVLRVITVNVPYVNRFYNDPRCEGHEELNVCNNEFLNYKLSDRAFISLIEDSYESDSESIEKDEITNEEQPKFFDELVKVAKKVYIPVLLVLGSSIITYLIFSTIYRKVKHGL